MVTSINKSMLLVVDDEEADDRKKSLLMAPTQAFVDDSAR